MDVIESIPELRRAREHLHGKVGLVPTMGALHDGHIALVRQAKAETDHVIVTIFVNPTQFAQNEDLSKYPRDLPRDLELLRAAGVDIVFTPSADQIYPQRFQTWIDVERVSQGLEGERRPGHFRGVATVVAKLFNLTQPHRAYFGQKDAQQVVVLKQMVRDLNFPVMMRICPTVREADGLAMSSRNVYLDPKQRLAAGVIYKALQAASTHYSNGVRDTKRIRVVIEEVLKQETLAEIDYISITDAASLKPLQAVGDQPLLMSLVVRIGTTRLLDNTLLPMDYNTLEGLTQVLGAG